MVWAKWVKSAMAFFKVKYWRFFVVKEAYGDDPP
jgi:hypothetical protein